MTEESFLRTYHELDETEKKLLLLRMKKHSYSFIYEYSKIKRLGYGEIGIKKLVDRYLHTSDNHYEEDKFQGIFSLFSWDYKNFLKAFKQTQEIFLYLDYKYIKGIRRIPKYLKRVDMDTDSFIFMGMEIDYSILGYVALKLFEDYLNGNVGGKTSKQLLQGIKNIGKNASINQIERVLSTNEDIIEVKDGRYRYFDRSEVIKKQRAFEKAFNKKDGIYSLENIYHEDEQLYASLGLMNPVMLGDIANKCRAQFIHCNKYKVLSYPYVLYGDISKKDFFDRVVSKYHRIGVEEASQKIAYEYGIDANYVQANLKLYNKGMIDESENLNRNKILLTEKQIAVLKKRLVNAYYSLTEFERIVKKVKDNASNRFFYSEEINKLGYRREYDYFIRADINDIKRYLEKAILSHEFIRLNRYENIDALYKGVVEGLQRSFKLIRLSDDELITSKKLKNIGIYKKDIDAFLKEVQMRYMNGFFTVKQLMNEFNHDFINSISFNEVFYENILEASTRVYSFTIERNKLYCFDSNMNSRKMFLAKFLDNIGDSIYIDELSDEIERKYGFVILDQTVRSLSEENGFYCCDILRKIYRDKNIYLEEVFGNG